MPSQYPSIPPEASRKLALYRAAAAVLAALVTGATAVWGPRAPWLSGVLSVLEAAVLFGIGKALGVPIATVTQLALSIMAEKRPEHAESVALATLQSLPPRRTTAATQQLFASLPPSSRARASIVPQNLGERTSEPTLQFVGLDEGEDGPDPAQSNTP